MALDTTPHEAVEAGKSPTSSIDCELVDDGATAKATAAIVSTRLLASASRHTRHAEGEASDTLANHPSVGMASNGPGFRR